VQVLFARFVVPVKQGKKRIYMKLSSRLPHVHVGAGRYLANLDDKMIMCPMI
jgi:hypothetical protein